jgi:hypothetical protein
VWGSCKYGDKSAGSGATELVTKGQKSTKVRKGGTTTPTSTNLINDYTC